MKKILTVLALSALGAGSSQSQVTFLPSTTGAWNVGSNYVGGVPPTTGQSVTLNGGSVIQFNTGTANLGNFSLDDNFQVHTIEVSSGGSMKIGNVITDDNKRLEVKVSGGSAEFGFMGIGGQSNIQLYDFNLGAASLLKFGNIRWAGVDGSRPGTTVNLTLNGSGSNTPITTNDFADLDNYIALNLFGGTTGWTVGQTVDLVQVTSNTIDWGLGTVSGSFIDNPGVTYNVFRTGANNILRMQITAIPEPSTILLLLGAVGALVLMRRRRASIG